MEKGDIVFYQYKVYKRPVYGSSINTYTIKSKPSTFFNGAKFIAGSRNIYELEFAFRVKSFNKNYL